MTQMSHENELWKWMLDIDFGTHRKQPNSEVHLCNLVFYQMGFSLCYIIHTVCELPRLNVLE